MMEIVDGVVPTGRAMIMLVEDDPAVRRSIQLLLQARGFDIRAYADGTRLVADESNAAAICCIADYLPGTPDAPDGIAVLARLRARRWEGPAILITAFPDFGLKRRAMDAGFSAVYEKPLRPRIFVDAVVRLIVDQ